MYKLQAAAQRPNFDGGYSSARMVSCSSRHVIVVIVALNACCRQGSRSSYPSVHRLDELLSDHSVWADDVAVLWNASIRGMNRRSESTDQLKTIKSLERGLQQATELPEQCVASVVTHGAEPTDRSSGTDAKLRCTPHEIGLVMCMLEMFTDQEQQHFKIVCGVIRLSWSLGGVE